MIRPDPGIWVPALVKPTRAKVGAWRPDPLHAGDRIVTDDSALPNEVDDRLLKQVPLVVEGGNMSAPAQP